MKKILIIEVIIIGLIGGYLLMQFIGPSGEKRMKTIESVKVEETIAPYMSEETEAQASLSSEEIQGTLVSEEAQATQVPQKAEGDEVQKPKVSSKKASQADETVKESALAGKIICIDAGHQSQGNSNQEPIGPGSTETKAKVSSGTKGVATGKYEYELNLEVALKLKAALMAKGAIVYMVRETNEVDISNKERAQLANEVGANLSLRIHADGSENSSANGFSLLVPGGSFLTEEVVSESYIVATYMEEYLTKGIENVSRGIVTREDLSGFNWSEVPAVLVEMGFMSNPEEDQRMSTEAFQEDIVTALVDSLEAYYAVH